MKNLIKVLLIGISLGAIFIGCGDSKDKLVVATAANFAPFEYRDGEEFKGIDMDIAKKIAEKVGKELVIKDTEFASILAAVEGQNAHVGISGFTINDERAKIVNFSDTYFNASQMVIIKNTDKRFEKVKDAKELKDTLDALSSKTPLKIGVQVGTTGQFYAEGSVDFEFSGIANAKVITYENGGMALVELKNDKLDMVIIDEMPARVLVANEPNAILLPFALTQEQYAIAVNKNDAELLQAINEVLAELKASGELEKIFTKYYKN